MPLLSLMRRAAELIHDGKQVGNSVVRVVPYLCSCRKLSIALDVNVTGLASLRHRNATGHCQERSMRASWCAMGGGQASAHQSAGKVLPTAVDTAVHAKCLQFRVAFDVWRFTCMLHGNDTP